MEQIQSSCLRACQQIGTETKAVIHRQVLEAIIEGNIVFVWMEAGKRDTIDVYNWRLLPVSDF